MKNLIFKMMLLPISLLAACGNKSQIIDFIPGTYVNQAQSGYSIASDTLIITQAENTQNIYLITRKTGYRRINDGKIQALQHQVKRLTGTWDEQKQLLQIMQNGTLISFQPEQNKLLIQNSEYWKL
jgi:hypothetical protein